MVFVDTSVIIDFLAGDKHVVSLLGNLPETEEVKTTAITEYELLKHKDKLKKHLAEDFLSEVTVVSFDSEAARKSALLYGKLKEAGKLINENDLLIAGIAIANDENLLTRDQKFGNINNPNIKVV